MHVALSVKESDSSSFIYQNGDKSIDQWCWYIHKATWCLLIYQCLKITDYLNISISCSYHSYCNWQIFPQ